GTIIWNPELRSELERGCDGDPARPVVRDPVASLLHEMVHAVDDCEGRDASAHELEAVRIENIYRRAAGLCQRAAYGETPLPAEVVKSCSPAHSPAGSRHGAHWRDPPRLSQLTVWSAPDPRGTRATSGTSTQESPSPRRCRDTTCHPGT